MDRDGLAPHALMLRDTLCLLLEELAENRDNPSEYQAGVRFGIARCIALLKSQCETCGLSEADLGIADFDIVSELISGGNR